MKFAIIIVTLFTSFVAPTIIAPAKLEYNLKVGDEFEMKQQTNQNIKQNIMGMEQDGKSEYAGIIKFKVKSASAETADVEARFVKLRNSSTTMMGENTMDSEGPMDKDQNKIFKAMMDKPFTLTLKKNGTIEKITGTENLWSDVDKLGIEPKTLATIREAMVQFMSESSLRKSMAQAFVLYSGDKVSEGDTWKSSSDFPMDFPIRIDNTWKLLKHDGTTSSIEANGVYTTTDANRIVTLPGGFKAKVDLTGSQTLNASIKNKSGWADMNSIQSTLKGKMILQAGGMIPTDMDIPMEIVTKTTYTVVRK